VRQPALQLAGEPQPVQVSYPAAVQQASIDTMRFADGSSIRIVEHGAGKVLWAAEPVELAENYEPAAALYRFAMHTADVSPAFRELQPLSPGVLAFATTLKDAVLYSFSSESLENQQIDIEDHLTETRLNFRLASALLGLAYRSVTAKKPSRNQDPTTNT